MAHAKLELLTTADMASHDAAPAADEGISSVQSEQDTRYLPTSADMASHVAVTAAMVKAFPAALAGQRLKALLSLSVMMLHLQT